MATSRISGTKGDGNQISADDINTALGRPVGTEVNFGELGLLFGVQFGGDNSLELDEFKGRAPGDNAEFAYGMAGVQGFEVDINGDVTAPTANIGAITNLSYSSGYSNGSYGQVSSATERSVTVSIRVPAGYSNANATVTGVETYDQPIYVPAWSDDDISIGSWSVSSAGVITAPSVTITGNLSYTITYTDINGVEYSTFPMVGNSTTPRYANVTVTVPNTYSNPGSYTKTRSTYQADASYPSQYPQIIGFDVDGDGQITQPTSIIAPGVATEDITLTYSGSPNLNKGYPISLTSTQNRTVTATLTIPAGYYDTDDPRSNSVTVVQPIGVLSGTLYYPYSSGQTFQNWSPGATGGVYENLNFWGASESAAAYLTFALVTNVEVVYTVSEQSSYVQIVQPTTDTALSSFTTTTAVPTNPHFRIKATAPSAGSSYTFSLELQTTTVSNKNFSIDFTLGRTASSPTISTVSTVDTVLPTVRQPINQ